MRRLLSLLSPWLILPALLAGGCSASDETAEIWPLQKQCDLHKGPCTARQGGRAVTLSITPRPIPVAKPLHVAVRLKNMPAREVALDIAGINMYMGYNRTTLNRVGPGRWEGRGILAFCTSRRMQWQLSVLVTQPDGRRIQIPFYLETVRPSGTPAPR